MPQDASGRAELDITANVSPALVDKIRALGGIVVYAYPESHAIRAQLALGKLSALASDPAIIAIRPASDPEEEGVTAVGGDIAHEADVTRRLYGTTGAGTKVCVLSDTPDTDHNDLDAAYELGALDRAHTTILSGQNGFRPAGKNRGEGLAMMEIIHSIAPGADIEFATGRTGAAQMANNIRKLGTDERCKIIVDDETYSDEPPFQDGEIGKAVNEVSQRGVYYFSSAGNYGNLHSNNPSVWEGEFTDGGAFTDTGSTRQGGNLNLFAVGKTFETIETPAANDKSERISLFWNDPWLGRANNYDLYVADSTGHIYAEATSSGLPLQSINLALNATHTKLSVDDRILIVKETGSVALFLHLDIAPRTKFDVVTHGRTRGHNASGAANAFSVGALQVSDPAAAFVAEDPVASFSSDGPRRVFFDESGNQLTSDLGADGGVVLNKPDFLAASHVYTTVPGFKPFSGTSAAAPHAAAIAALLLSRFPTITPKQMRDMLTRGTLPDGAGPWNDYAGAGILMASSGLHRSGESVTAIVDHRWDPDRGIRRNLRRR